MPQEKTGSVERRKDISSVFQNIFHNSVLLLILWMKYITFFLKCKSQNDIFLLFFAMVNMFFCGILAP